MDARIEDDDLSSNGHESETENGIISSYCFFMHRTWK